MTYTHDQLKDIIANMDMDYYIIHRDCRMVAEALFSNGYGYHAINDIRKIIIELQSDPYFVLLAKRLA